MQRIVHFLDDQGAAQWGVLAHPGLARALSLDIIQSKIMDVGALSKAPLVRVVRLLAPVPAPPPNVFGIGLNYPAHAAEGSRAAPDRPLIFLKASTSVIGPGEPIVLPRSAPAEVDFEAELAIVIGRTARRVPASRALEYVLGFTCANDVSARDCQKRLDGQWARGKSFDTFCPLGPWLVPPHEFDPTDADITCVLNGVRMQQANTREMIFSCAELVSYLSHQFTLLPWTVICTGTPSGVGMARTPPVFLGPGDTVTVSVEGIGELTNPVVADEPEGPPGNNVAR